MQHVSLQMSDSYCGVSGVSHVTLVCTAAMMSTYFTLTLWTHVISDKCHTSCTSLMEFTPNTNVNARPVDSMHNDKHLWLILQLHPRVLTAVFDGGNDAWDCNMSCVLLLMPQAREQ